MLDLEGFKLDGLVKEPLAILGRFAFAGLNSLLLSAGASELFGGFHLVRTGGYRAGQRFPLLVSF